LIIDFLCCSGAPPKYLWQARQDVIRLNSTQGQRRRTPEGKVINPCEKSRGTFILGFTFFLANNHWAITSFTQFGEAAVTLTSGSGSFIDACMRLGRSCLALEVNGSVYCFHYFCRRTIYCYREKDERGWSCAEAGNSVDDVWGVL
jgi:hypothetical protein